MNSHRGHGDDFFNRISVHSVAFYGPIPRNRSKGLFRFRARTLRFAQNERRAELAAASKKTPTVIRSLRCWRVSARRGVHARTRIAGRLSRRGSGGSSVGGRSGRRLTRCCCLGWNTVRLGLSHVHDVAYSRASRTAAISPKPSKQTPRRSGRCCCRNCHKQCCHHHFIHFLLIPPIQLVNLCVAKRMNWKSVLVKSFAPTRLSRKNR